MSEQRMTTGRLIQRGLVAVAFLAVIGCGSSQRPSPAATVATLASPVATLASPVASPASPVATLASPVASPASPAASPSAAVSASPATAAGFVRPFEYSINAETTLRLVAGVPRREIVAWVDGPDYPPNPDAQPRYGGQAPGSGSLAGIIVASAEEAWSHGPSGRFMLRTTPAGMIADLRDTAAVPMGTIEQTTLDGRPALTVPLVGLQTRDIHVTGQMKGLALDFVLLAAPSRLTVADIDGTTVFVLVWARTAADMGAMIPVAGEFLASIHFLPESQP
jgi:hypothetical protein